jgi:hypothetical protein
VLDRLQWQLAELRASLDKCAEVLCYDGRTIKLDNLEGCADKVRRSADKSALEADLIRAGTSRPPRPENISLFGKFFFPRRRFDAACGPANFHNSLKQRVSRGSISSKTTARR